jgi:hypothetical protein
LKDYEDLLVEKNGDLIHLEFYWLLAKTTSTISIEEKHERSQVKEKSKDEIIKNLEAKRPKEHVAVIKNLEEERQAI